MPCPSAANTIPTAAGGAVSLPALPPSLLADKQRQFQARSCSNLARSTRSHTILAATGVSSVPVSLLPLCRLLPPEAVTSVCLIAELALCQGSGKNLATPSLTFLLLTETSKLSKLSRLRPQL